MYREREREREIAIARQMVLETSHQLQEEGFSILDMALEFLGCSEIAPISALNKSYSRKTSAAVWPAVGLAPLDVLSRIHKVPSKEVLHHAISRIRPGQDGVAPVSLLARSECWRLMDTCMYFDSGPLVLLLIKSFHPKSRRRVALSLLHMYCDPETSPQYWVTLPSEPWRVPWATREQNDRKRKRDWLSPKLDVFEVRFEEVFTTLWNACGIDVTRSLAIARQLLPEWTPPVRIAANRPRSTFLSRHDANIENRLQRRLALLRRRDMQRWEGKR